MGVKFLAFTGKLGKQIRRCQYTAIDDATRVRALKIYIKHTQANAIDFVDRIIEKFPFRIKEIRTDNGHEYQAKFHRHVEDQAIRHAYIKRVTPQLKGKINELADRLFSVHGVKAHPASLSRLLLAHGFTVKKTLLASEPIALTLFVSGAYGRRTVSPG